MDIRHRLYPYPVLSDATDDYVDSSFSMDLKVTQGIREIRFNILLNLVNNGIQQLIDNGLAEYVVHIECPYTAYRTVVITSDANIEKNIPEFKVNGKVEICAFIVAKSEQSSYYNPCFNEDYGGTSFHLYRGNIIAIGGQINLNIVKDVEELSKIPSIFTICRSAVDIDDSMKIDVYGEKIAITLSSASFVNYKILTGTPQYLPVLHSMLIVPTLIYTFEKLKSEGIEDFEDLRWFKSVERTLRKNGLKLNNELLQLTPSFELAQKSLDMPINRALEMLASHDTFDEEE